MECNKEEALRAMELAQKKLQENEFATAQKLAQKAQRLYPEIENITRLLTVCEVHCSSLVKIGGSEMDWYRILQIEQTADITAIKKQYRKLAFLLHPDKNMFAGAEAAFKLIGDANRTLSDEAKRSLYDRKFRDLSRSLAPKPSRSQGNGKSSAAQNRSSVGKNSQYYSYPTNSGSYSNQQVHTFWTQCPTCGVRYQYFRTCLKATLICHGCHCHYVAEEIAAQNMPPAASHSVPNQKEVDNQVPIPSQAKKKPRPRKKPATTSKAPPQPVSEERNASKSNGVFEAKERDSELNKQGVEMPKADSVKLEKTPSSKNSSRKRARKSVMDPSESEDEDEDVVEETANCFAKFSEGHSRRKSSRRRHDISYKEKLSDDDDDFVNPPKRSRASKSASAEETGKGSDSNINGHKYAFKPSSSSPLNKNLPGDNQSDAKEKEANAPDHQKSRATEVSTDDDSDDEAGSPETYDCPDPDFSNFEKGKAENCFAPDQIWAVYDPEDGMPRYYARIRKICSPEFELKITWLEAEPEKESEMEWCEMELPVACGKYKLGITEKVCHNTFSHQVNFVKGSRKNYWVYPTKGETWAIFRDWDINWSSDPDKHKPFKYDFVVVLSDFDKGKGVGVAYLERVKGFVSIFQQKRGQVQEDWISTDELYMFSHRIPSFQMTGTERKGVPQGSYELDPAALPQSLFEPCDDENPEKDNDVKVEANVQKSEAVDVAGDEEISADTKRPSKSSDRETLLTRRSPRNSNINGQTSESQGVFGADHAVKTDKSHVNLSPAKQGLSQADENLKTPKKPESHSEEEAFNLRRSPRDVGKKIGNQSASEDSFKKPTETDKVKPVADSTPSDDLSQTKSFDSNKLISKDGFKVKQIWALRLNGESCPKTYGLVKKVDSKSQVYLQLLEPYPPITINKTRRVCCGIFRVRPEKSRVYKTSLLSHCMTTAITNVEGRVFEIYPHKGEIWALYKKQSNDECNVVEVLERGDKSTKIVVLSRFGGSESIYKAPRTQRSKGSAVVEIPQAEMFRFSHRIPAVQCSAENDSRLVGAWELDPKSIPASTSEGVICLD